MEKALFSLLFTANELDIVDKQHIGAAVFTAEIFSPALTNRVDEFVGKLFGANENDPQTLLIGGISDSIQQMGFAQTYTAVNIQRVIAAEARFFGGAHSGGISQAVAVADDKTVECIFRIKPS